MESEPEPKKLSVGEEGGREEKGVKDEEPSEGTVTFGESGSMGSLRRSRKKMKRSRRKKRVSKAQKRPRIE